MQPRKQAQVKASANAFGSFPNSPLFIPSDDGTALTRILYSKQRGKARKVSRQQSGDGSLKCDLRLTHTNTDQAKKVLLQSAPEINKTFCFEVSFFDFAFLAGSAK